MALKFIVTGGAGFIGSNLVAALNAAGEPDILIVDRLGHSEKWRNLVGLQFEDYMDKADFRRNLDDERWRGVATVFHLGACSSTTETDADYLADNNYRYTRELCEWCLKSGKRFIYASSAATYGDGQLGYDDTPALLPRLRPLNMYGYSKHMFDLWAWRNDLFSRIAGLKYFNVFGPGEAHKGEMRSMVHKAVEQIKAEGRVSLFRSHRPEFADGEQRRDFVYVKDSVRVTLFMHEHQDVGGLFNCGAGRARTWNDLARAVFAALDRPPCIEYVDMPAALRGKYQYHTQAATARLQQAGYNRPFTDLEEAVREYVQSLQPA
ncbi:MAG: ADP-glyceromanno-heptose 6-epimerase [Kiritimatiellia bacterium]|nr:ADP-glyceromanno-heptose 6-epimerase [Lentisphaerota bacterium]